MTITYAWYVPDTLTITDPAQHGPMVAAKQGDFSNVAKGVRWACQGVADDTAKTSATIASYSPFGEPNPATFVDLSALTADEIVAQLKIWLFTRINQADIENQVMRKIIADQSPPKIVPVSQLAAPPTTTTTTG